MSAYLDSLSEFAITAFVVVYIIGTWCAWRWIFSGTDAQESSGYADPAQPRQQYPAPVARVAQPGSATPRSVEGVSSRRDDHDESGYLGTRLTRVK